MKELKCIVCGTRLFADVNTFGDVGQEMCWTCHSSFLDSEDQEWDDEWYGMAPHHHDTSRTGSFIGSTIFDPLPDTKNEYGEYWIESAGAWFLPDDEVGGAQGMWRKQP